MPAYVKISQLASAAAVTGEHLFELVQSGSSVKAAASDVADYVAGASALTAVFAPSITAPAEKSADYTITGRDDSRTIYMTCGASTRTVTLPASAGLELGDRFQLNKVDNGAGVARMRSAGADTIDGITTVTLDSIGDYVAVEWNGTEFTVTMLKDAGSDTEGYFQRFADGSMRQWGTFSFVPVFVRQGTAVAPYAHIVYRYVDANQDMPRSFISTTFTVVGNPHIDPTSNFIQYFAAAPVDTDSFEWGVQSNYNYATPVEITVEWVAFGRWRA